MKKLVTIGLLVLVSLAVLAPVALAVSLPTPTAPGTPGSGVSLRDVENVIRRIAEFLIIFGVVIAVILIIWAGITYMFAGGSDEKVKLAKKRFWNGVIGAAIILGVGVILQTLARLLNQSFFQ